MKYPKAYCCEIDDCLSIYEVRDLNFDEGEEFDSENVTFLCPDAICREDVGRKALLTTVNAKNRKYKKSPHFRDIPSTEHSSRCSYKVDYIDTLSRQPTSTHEEGIKETDFPEEFLPSQKKYPRKLKESEGELEHAERRSSQSNIRAKANGRKTSVNRTSQLEHIVECYISNSGDKKLLKRMPLTISGATKNYWSYFKKVQYFQDGQGFIYWGKIKKIVDYIYRPNCRVAVTRCNKENRNPETTQIRC